jgi:small subunit ribosomal protein S14
MRYLLIKNKKIYKLIYSFELKRLQYKTIIFNENLPFYIRQHAVVNLNRLHNNKNSFVNIHQRCFFTNRGRSVFNFFKISRIKLRCLLSNNYITGIKKST